MYFSSKTGLLRCVLVALLCSSGVFGQVTFSFINNEHDLISERNLYFYTETLEKMTFDDVAPLRDSFHRLSPLDIPRHLSQALWTKFYLKNTTLQGQAFVLHRIMGSDTELDYYVEREDTSVQHFKSGGVLPYAERQVAVGNGIRFTMNAGETVTVFTRTVNHYLFRAGFIVHSESYDKDFLNGESKKYLFVLSMLIGVLIVNGIIASIFRAMRFVFYLGGILLFVSSTMIYSGFVPYFMPYINGGWSNALPVLQAAMTILFLLFTKHFLQKLSRKKVHIYFLAVTISLWLITAFVALTDAREHLFYPQLVLSVVSYSWMILAGILYFKINRYNAVRYLLSIALMAFLHLYYFGLLLGVFPYGEVNYLWVVILLVVQVTLFSFSMIQKDIRDAVLDMQAKYALNSQRQMFLRNISHELRTPINGVVGAIELLLRTKKTPHQHELLDSADQAMQKIMSVVNDFVEVAINDGRFLQIKKDPYDFLYEVNGVLGSLEKLAIVKGLRFEKLLPKRVQNYLVGDAKRVMFLITRLISLSIKYTSHGFVKLICEVEETIDGTIEVHFIIQDSGTTPAGEFLSITKEKNIHDESDVKVAENYLFVQLVELVNAQVWYEPLDFNGDTIGTEYHMVIEQGLGDECHYEELPAHEIPTITKGLSVLVAEDDLVNQKIISKTLENLNHKFRIVGNGSECVKEWMQNKYDLILMDIQMPVMNGFEAALEIRLREKKSDVFKHIPIIALSAREEMYMHNECKRHGINSYLPKPFKMEQLESEIESFFKM
ncbi:MAG: response regulator [Fibrobacterales bacterium]